MDDLDVYLDVLFDGLSGLVYSPVKTGPNDADWENNWFNYPQQGSALKKHIVESTTLGDVYISPAVYAEKRSTKDAVKTIQTVWVEFDGVDKIDIRETPVPSLIVQTSSPTHVHCYWRTEPTSGKAVEDINRRLTYYLHADPTGWDSTQLLRPPNTLNHKYPEPKKVHLSNKELTGPHPVGVFEFVPEVPAPTITVTSIEKLPDADQVLKEHSLAIKLLKMIKKEMPDEGHRSSFLFRLANELAEEGLKHDEIVSLLKVADDRVGKYSKRRDQLERLSQIADFAVHKHNAEQDLVVYTPEYILKYTEDLTWILPGLLHSTGQMVLASAPAVGKTQLCMQLAYCLEKGERWLGFLAPTKHKPFFMSLEMDKVSLKYILNHQKSEWQSLPTFNIIDEQASWSQYEDLIDRLQSTVIIIDSLTELMEESADNPNVEARRLMKWCRKIRRRYGVAIILIHHNRKATEGNKKPKNLSDLAGSFLFAKDTDTVLQLWEDSKGIELSGVKVRFGRKDLATFMVERNEHLWFRRKGIEEDDTSERDEPIPDDPEPTPRQQVSSDRLGDKPERKNALGEVSFGFGSKD